MPNSGELNRCRRDELRRSVSNPHQETAGVAAQSLGEWASGLPDEDTEALLDLNAGTEIHWISGQGWVKGRVRSWRSI